MVGTQAYGPIRKPTQKKSILLARMLKDNNICHDNNKLVLGIKLIDEIFQNKDIASKQWL